MRRLKILAPLVTLAAAAWLGRADPADAQYCRTIPEAASLVAALNDFWNRDFVLCQSYDPHDSASAYPGRGVVQANRRWLATIADEYGVAAAAGILAHEWGHMVLGGAPGPRTELQADCLAGAFMRQARFDRSQLGQFMLVSLDSGDFGWNVPSHGTGPQRRDAIWRGYFGFRGRNDRRLASYCFP